MTKYEIVKSKLENFPDFRERGLRSEYLAILALRELELEDMFNDKRPLTLKDMVEFAISYDSYRHAWTDVLKDNKHLRGKDYDDKVALQEQKRLEYSFPQLSID